MLRPDKDGREIMKATIKKFKKAIEQGELSTVKSVLENRARDEQRLIVQAITLDNLESLKHNENHPSWEHAGYGGGNQLPPNE